MGASSSALVWSGGSEFVGVLLGHPHPDLAKWRRFALAPDRVRRRRWADPFETDMPGADAIRARLAKAETAEDVRRAFEKWGEAAHEPPVRKTLLWGAGSELVLEILKGDLPGHAFRGNQWTEGGGVSRDALPDHVRAVVPPAYTVVGFNPEPDAECIAIVKDGKGREKRLYSAERHAREAAGKFARIDEMQTKFTGIMRQNARLMESPDDRVRQNAECFHVVATTGLRPGSDKDTKADVQAYGATTLRREHVVVEGDEVRLRFTGKNGKSLDLAVADPKAATILRDRAAAAGEGERIFPEVTDRSLLAHTHDMDGGGFKTKDLRTHLGTSIAAEAVKSMPEPKTEAERKKAIRAVGDAVAKRLGNTRTVALQAYISPSVFNAWGRKVKKADSPEVGFCYPKDGELVDVSPAAVDWRSLPDEPDPDDEPMARTPDDVVLMLGFDPADDLEKMAEDQPRDEHGRWTSGALVAEGEKRMRESRRYNSLGSNSDTLATLAYPGRRTKDGMDEIRHVAEKAGSLDSAVRAIDSQTKWGGAWATAIDEWRAAEAAGGNGAMSRTTKEELAGGAGWRDKGPLSDSDRQAFAARREWMQQQFRKEYGKKLTVYRGVHGAYAKKVDDELPSYALSSWTPDRSVAMQFAKGKAGLVVATEITADDVWILPRRGVEGVLKVADARDEIVILNKGKARKVKRIW